MGSRGPCSRLGVHLLVVGDLVSYVNELLADRCDGARLDDLLDLRELPTSFLRQGVDERAYLIPSSGSLGDELRYLPEMSEARRKK
jgi:hypothetical protein